MSEDLKDNICEAALFERIYTTHSKNLHAFLYYKFGEHINPRDIVQDAFIKLWQNCSKIPPAKAKSFLFTTANNLTLNAVAHNKVVLRFKNIPKKNVTTETPEFILQEKEFHEKLQNALSKLTEAQRTAFLLNRIEGKRFKDIAELLNISTKAVEKRIYGALKKLRKDIDGL